MCSTSISSSVWLISSVKEAKWKDNIDYMTQDKLLNGFYTLASLPTLYRLHRNIKLNVKLNDQPGMSSSFSSSSAASYSVTRQTYLAKQKKNVSVHSINWVIFDNNE